MAVFTGGFLCACGSSSCAFALPIVLIFLVPVGVAKVLPRIYVVSNQLLQHLGFCPARSDRGQWLSWPRTWKASLCFPVPDENGLRFSWAWHSLRLPGGSGWGVVCLDARVTCKPRRDHYNAPGRL